MQFHLSELVSLLLTLSQSLKTGGHSYIRRHIPTYIGGHSCLTTAHFVQNAFLPLLSMTSSCFLWPTPSPAYYTILVLGWWFFVLSSPGLFMWLFFVLSSPGLFMWLFFVLSSPGLFMWLFFVLSSPGLFPLVISPPDLFPLVFLCFHHVNCFYWCFCAFLT